MLAVPALTPVTNPDADPTVAIPGLLLVQESPVGGVVDVKMVTPPTQIPAAPDMAPNPPPTVMYLSV